MAPVAGWAFRLIICMFTTAQSRSAPVRFSTSREKADPLCRRPRRAAAHRHGVPFSYRAMPVYIYATALEENRVLEMTNENVARLLTGLTIAVGNRKNRILLYQFLAAEIRALHCSYGIGDGESYQRALSFLENCERFTLRSLVRKSAKHHVEVTVDHAKEVFSHAIKKQAAA